MTTLLDRAIEMRNAIDHLESEMMGLGKFVDLPQLFEGTADGVVLSPRLSVGQVRRVCEALSECTRIINSEEYSPAALRALAKRKAGRREWMRTLRLLK